MSDILAKLNTSYIPQHSDNWRDTMGIYESFAYLYATGDYPQYSQRITLAMPALFEHFQTMPRTILDLACGEGTFAVTMAKLGFQVTGIDRSKEMLKFAKEKIEKEDLEVQWIQQDMRNLNFSEAYDLVTCWFDSLNYLLDLEDLTTTFKGVFHALRKGGLFIFDLNTIFWLVTLAQRYGCVVERETSEIFQVHRHSYDFEHNIATFNITGFIKEEGRWLRRIDEVHKERGYTLEEVRSCLAASRLQELACWEDLKDRKSPTPESRRVFFVAKK